MPEKNEDSLPDSPRFLIVEDDFLVSELIMDALVEIGITSSSVAYSLADASSLIARYDFAGAVLDFNVKGEMTFEFAEELQARGVPFLFVSGYDTAPDYLARFPGIALLRKPFRIDELGEAMKKLRHGA